MVRLGFDPGLEAQQDHKALIRENELLRLSQECTTQVHSRFLGSSRILARLGKGIVAVGSSIEARFSDGLDEDGYISTKDSSTQCYS